GFRRSAPTEIYPLSLHDALPIFIVDANERALVDDFAMGGLLDIAPDGGAGDPAAEAGEDQRALAAIAYECLTGTPLGDNLPAGEDGLPGLPLHVAQALRRAVSSRQ